MRDVSRFPNGVSDEGQTRRAGRTSITGKATIATGLDTVTGVVASLETISSVAKHGFTVQAKASASEGSVDVTVYDKEANEATAAAVEVAWIAYGEA